MNKIFPETDKTIWKKASVGELFYVKGRIGWRGLRRSQFVEQGPYLITGMHLSRGQVQWNNCFHISQEKFLESPEIIVQVGDIIITKDGTIGKVAYIDYLPGPTSLNSHLFLVRPKVGIVNRRFAYHIFNSWIFNRYIEDHQTGSTLSGLSERHFLNFPFPLPTLSEQQRIAKILDTIDEKIEHTEQLIAKLKLQKSGILHDVFTLGFEEHGQLRNPIAHPEQFKDSVLGRIPKEWSIREFEELADIIDPQPNHRAPVEVAGGEPYIGVGDLRADGSINFESCRKVSREAVTKQQQRFRIEAGDIIFGKIGTIGFPQFLPQGIRYALNANTVLIKPKENPPYILWLLRSSFVERHIQMQVHSTSQPAFGIQRIRAMLVPLPCEDERRRIGIILDSHEASIIAEEAYFNSNYLGPLSFTQKREEEDDQTEWPAKPTTEEDLVCARSTNSPECG